MAYKRLGDILISVGLLTDEQLQSALQAQKKSGKKLGEVLVEGGYIKQSQLFDALQRQLGVEFIDLTSYTPPAELSRVLPRAIAKKYNVVPVRADSATLYLAMDDPLNFMAVEAAKTATRRKITPMLATSEGVSRALANLYGSEGAERALEELKGESDGFTAQNIVAANIIGADSENAAPTIRLVNSILEYAVNQNASDIHLEPREREMVVRMRIDGVLRRVFNVPRATQSAVIARIKVMGNMNIAEHKIPLDGRSNIRVNDKDVDLRISTLPTVYGEKVVIRLLNKSSALLNTKGIGLTDKNLKKFNALLENSNGVILIVGPTGSGKSSSMYTMIGQLNTDEVNLVTLEDPVEYNFDGVNQVQINEKTGMTFASGLRSILRQDPDIIAVGEIRDGETADIAIRAAITGHLVLSTLHTNDAASTILRLVDMGVAPYMVASSLVGVIAQRLVKLLCPECREKILLTDPADLRLVGKTEPVEIYQHHIGGCPACRNTGYKGRTAIHEIIVSTNDIKELISRNATAEEIGVQARKNGTRLLRDNVTEMVLDGRTTMDELVKATYSV